MSTPMTMTNCPSEETLAAFIDGRLDPESRRRVVEHMSSCADCYSVISAAWDLQAADPAALPAPAPVVRGRFDSRTVWAPAAAALAAAAMVSFVFLYAPLHDRLFPPKTGIEALVEASEGLRYRPTDGRIVGGFPYRKHSVNRGDKDKEDENLTLLIAASTAEEAAEKNPTEENRRALAIAYLMNKRAGDAVERLETLLRQKTGKRDLAEAITTTTDTALLIDLAAAWLARGATKDANLAMSAAERAWTLGKTPEAAWNRAVAAQRLDSTQEAIDRWEQYLVLDPSSPWAAEARNRLSDLRTDRFSQ